MKITFLQKSGAALLLAGLSFSAQAQSSPTFGVRLGGNLTTFNLKDVEQDATQFMKDTKSVGGLQIGATMNMPFGKVAFQPSLIYTQKGAELNGAAQDMGSGFNTVITLSAKPKLNYLELPLNVVYTSGEEEGFQLFAGPYVAMGVGGSGSYNVNIVSSDPDAADFVGDHKGNLKIEYGDTQNDNESVNNSNTLTPDLTMTFKRLDFGLNGGIGYRVGPVQAQAGYGLGLVNFIPKSSDGTETTTKGYNRGFYLNATYFFGGK